MQGSDHSDPGRNEVNIENRLTRTCTRFCLNNGVFAKKPHKFVSILLSIERGQIPCFPFAI